MKFYKHMTNMRNDPRIKRVISKYGIEGYGLYNIILESIAERIEDQRPMPLLQENCEDLADWYNGNTAKINEMVNFMVNQGLFEVEEFEGRILCSKIYKFLESNQTRSEHIRKLINLYKNNSESQLLTYEKASQTVLDICEEEKRIEENRIEENRITPTKSTYDLNGIDIPINTTTHNQLITEYGEHTILDYYERVHDYSQSADKKYKDYAATARNWIKRDIQQGKGPVKQKAIIEKVSCPVCGFTMTASGCNICGLDRCDLDNQDVVDEFRTDYERRTKK